MKSLKFRPDLVKDVLAGRKTTTWRLFDDKDLREGDCIELLNWETGEKFADAQITRITEKQVADVSEADYEGHERYENQEVLLKTLQGYYGERVNLETVVKIIEFKLVKNI